MSGNPGGAERKNRSRAIAIAGAVASGVRRPGWFVLFSGWLSGIAAAALITEIDRRRFFLWLPVFYGVGIVAYFAAEQEPSLLASAFPVAAAIALAVWARARFLLFAAAIILATFFAGFLVASLRARSVAAPILAAPATVTVSGWIEVVNRTAYGGRMVVAVHDFAPALERMPARLRVTFRGGMTFGAGEAVQFRARLTPPAPPAVPGGFDFQREAYFQGLGAVGLVSGPIAAVDLGLPGFGTWMLAAVDRARNALTARIVAVIGGSTGAIAAALVTGKRGEIAEADNEAWRGAGIYHIISISGLHMVLAAGLFFWSARLVFTVIPGFSPQHATKKWAAVVAMIGAIAYDIFSGNEVATERSLIMTLVMLGAVLVDRPALAMRNLAISALIVLTLNPEAVLGPSFQMSFGAVAGLVTYGEVMRHFREKRTAHSDADQGVARRLAHGAFDFAMTSLIAGLATAPFQAYHFHRLNPYGLIGNALAIPICSFLVMPAALAGVLLYPLGLDAPAWTAMGWGISAINLTAGWVAAMPGAIATVLRFQVTTLALLTTGLLLFTLMTTAMFRTAGACMLCLGVVSASLSAVPDMILDPTGRSALVRAADRRLVFLGQQRPAFALQQWLPGDRDSRLPRDPELATGVRCDKSGCTFMRPDGVTVALVTTPEAFAEDCDRANLIITPLAAPEACWGRADIYDRAYFKAYGATYIYKTPKGAIHETARNPRIKRPWLPADEPVATAPPAPQLPQPGGSQWDPGAPDNLEAIPPQ